MAVTNKTFDSIAGTGTDNQWLDSHTNVGVSCAAIDSKYAYTGSTAKRLSVPVANATENYGTIQSITVYCRAKRDGTSATIYVSMYTNSTWYNSSSKTLTTSYTDYVLSYNTNPNTGAAWSWTDLNNLQIGAYCAALGGGTIAYVDYLRAVVAVKRAEGTSTITLSKVTSAASASRTHPSGTSTIELPNPTLASSGLRYNIATSNLTLPKVQLSATNIAGFVGTGVLTLPKITSQTTGYFHAATVDITLPKITLACSAKFYNEGSSTATLPLITLSVTGWDIQKYGIGTINLPGGMIGAYVSVAATGIKAKAASSEIYLKTPTLISTAFKKDIVAVCTLTLPKLDIAAIAGHVYYTNSADFTLPIITLASSAVFNRIGSVSLSLPQITLASTAVFYNSGSSDLTLSQITLACEADITNKALITLTLPKITLSSTAIVINVTGNSAIRLLKLQLNANGNRQKITSLALTLTKPVVTTTSSTTKSGVSYLTLGKVTLACAAIRNTYSPGTANLYLSQIKIQTIGYINLTTYTIGLGEDYTTIAEFLIDTKTIHGDNGRQVIRGDIVTAQNHSDFANPSYRQTNVAEFPMVFEARGNSYTSPVVWTANDFNSNQNYIVIKNCKITSSYAIGLTWSWDQSTTNSKVKYDSCYFTFTEPIHTGTAHVYVYSLEVKNCIFESNYWCNVMSKTYINCTLYNPVYALTNIYLGENQTPTYSATAINCITPYLYVSNYSYCQTTFQALGLPYSDPHPKVTAMQAYKPVAPQFYIDGTYTTGLIGALPGHNFASSSLTLPKPSVYCEGYLITATAALTLPATISVSAIGNHYKTGSASIELTRITLNATGVFTKYGTSSIDLKQVQIVANGIQIKTGSATVTLHQFLLLGGAIYQKTAVGVFDIPMIVPSATGNLARQVIGALTLPSLQFSDCSGYLTRFVTGSLTLPKTILVSTGSNPMPGGVETYAWEMFKNQIQSSTLLNTIVKTFAFSRKLRILKSSDTPFLGCYLQSTNAETYIGFRKKMVSLNILIHCKVINYDTIMQRRLIYGLDELVKKTLENMQLMNNYITIAVVQDSIVDHLSNYISEFQLKIELKTNLFNLGSRTGIGYFNYSESENVLPQLTLSCTGTKI